ncbi:MAG: membrane protein insertion efficiency factor YidD [Psychroflexus sp.]|nr:membrane protein insertion efficiency factor YidD [Psychroflexus sp.]MDN6309160.1 membrane protein insertion efficiency factor YidD [Psychroflexus sp.]
MKIVKTFIKFILQFLIKGYQLLISPLLGQNCRFQPTCSHYAKEAIEKHGSLKGLKLAFIRISKCHPWGSSGFDPVPENNNKNTH